MLNHSTNQASSFEDNFYQSTDTYIHPTAVVGNNVVLGDNVKIGPFCIIVGNTTIGANTRIFAHVTIGFPGQVVGLKESVGRVAIGSGCEIREFVTIHAPRTATGATTIGNNCYLMNFAHVSHDAVLEDNVTLINNVSLGGHTHVEKNAIVMANSATHQFCRIGRLTALAPFSGTRQDLPPFCLFSGQPARFYGLNVIGLKRAGFSGTDINAIKHVTKLFFQDKVPTEQITTIIQNDHALHASALVQDFMKFVHESTRGISRKTALNNNSQTEE